MQQRIMNGVVTVMVGAIGVVTVVGLAQTYEEHKRQDRQYLQLPVVRISPEGGLYENWKQGGPAMKGFELPDGRAGVIYTGKQDIPNSWPCDDFGKFSENPYENINTCVVASPRGM